MYLILKRLWSSSWKGRDYTDPEIILLWIICLIFAKGSKGKGKRPAKKNTADDGEPKSKKAKNADPEAEESIEDGQDDGDIDYACASTSK